MLKKMVKESITISMATDTKVNGSQTKEAAKGPSISVTVINTRVNGVTGKKMVKGSMNLLILIDMMVIG